MTPFVSIRAELTKLSWESGSSFATLELEPVSEPAAEVVSVQVPLDDVPLNDIRHKLNEGRPVMVCVSLQLVE